MLGDTEDRWTEIFAASGRTYHPPKLVLFRRAIQGGCGMAQSAMGPFYCPRDKQVYLDMSFFDELQNRFGACSSSNACRFSEAYVIAHEVGHHVQDELGILPKVQEAQQAASSKVEANEIPGARRARKPMYRRRMGANHAQAKHKFLDAVVASWRLSRGNSYSGLCTPNECVRTFATVDIPW